MRSLRLILPTRIGDDIPMLEGTITTESLGIWASLARAAISKSMALKIIRPGAGFNHTPVQAACALD